jgi:hypothetical protein
MNYALQIVCGLDKPLANITPATSRITDFIWWPLELQILKFCGGFPLALKVIGRSLCGKPEAVWHR